MRNIEKAELKKYVRELAQKGYSKKEAIKILKEDGYCESTARAYWYSFGNVKELNLKFNQNYIGD